jgi:hypothetical protein
MSVEILGRQKRRHKKYFRHASNLAARNLKKGSRKRNLQDKAGSKAISAGLPSGEPVFHLNACLNTLF